MENIVKYFFALSVFAAVFNAHAYEVSDSQGTVFKFSEPPKAATIVPAVTQNIYAVGAQKYLLGNSRYCNYPADAKTKIKLGGFIDPDYERIAALRPEIFILPKLSDLRIQERLKTLGIKCFFLHGEGLKNIASDLRMLGELFNCRADAEREATRIDKLIVDAAKLDKNSRGAFFMFGNMAAGKGSYVGEMLNLCGLRNCAENSNSAWATPSKEFIFLSKPDLIFVELPSEKERENILEFFQTDKIWRETPAVKNKKVFFIPRDLIGVPSSHAFDALELMRKLSEK